MATFKIYKHNSNQTTEYRRENSTQGLRFGPFAWTDPANPPQSIEVLAVDASGADVTDYSKDKTPINLEAKKAERDATREEARKAREAARAEKRAAKEASKIPAPPAPEATL